MSDDVIGQTLPFRSYLFAPASSGRKMAKAFEGSADAVIVDLEDAVANAQKHAARQAIAECLREPQARPTFVRVNGLETPHCWPDLHAVISPHLSGIVLPKVEAPSDLTTVDWVLGQLEEARGLTRGSLRIVPILETARGIACAQEIARASARIAALAFGAVDLASDMGLDITSDDGAVQSARFAIALASRTAGLPGPVDTAFIAIADLDALRESSARAKAMGYSGKTCIHPAQVEVVNAVFSPTADEVERARRIVTAFEAAETSGAAAVAVDGVMVDYPVVARAQRILAASGGRVGR